MPAPVPVEERVAVSDGAVVGVVVMDVVWERVLAAVLVQDNE